MYKAICIRGRVIHKAKAAGEGYKAYKASNQESTTGIQPTEGVAGTRLEARYGHKVRQRARVRVGYKVQNQNPTAEYPNE